MGGRVGWMGRRIKEGVPVEGMEDGFRRRRVEGGWVFRRCKFVASGGHMYEVVLHDRCGGMRLCEVAVC